jgi:DNA-binding SARP family transcriptional activator/tetratricopeptide (TPR) repeat protein
MEFRVLGPLEVVAEGRTVDLGGQKQRALLALLLLEANRVVSSDRLTDALWEDDPPETAQKALQVYVSQLRKALGRERLQTKAPGYLIRIEDGELDLHRFERLQEQGRLDDALALWRGTPLADFASQRFAQPDIARLEERRLACVEERVERELGAGRHAELTAELETLVEQHPLRERLRRQLMLALYRSGRQAEALQAFQDARRMLVDELGIEPTRELRDLHQAILRQDASLDLPREASTPQPPDEARAVFVGREGEIAELEAALDAALTGRGRLLLLVGEPGIGKTRLAEELVRQARARGARVLVGRCWEAGGAPAYWPWVQSLRAYVEETEPEALRAQLGAGAASLAQIVPELRERLPDLPEPAPLAAESARFRLFDATARFLRAAAAGAPLVLVLDDLHAADEASLLLLRFVAGELAGARLLVLGTYRNVDPTVRDPLATTLAELAREQVTQRLELAGLTPADVARYVELAAGAAPPRELVEAIHAETEGNPLFVGEVVRLLAAEGRLADVDARDLWALGIPQGVREVIGRRLRRLSEECVRVLTLASVAGREFGLDALTRVSELAPDELLGVLDEAVDARVVISVPDAPGRLRFAHALIRETLYDQLTTPRRVQLHRRVAEALEALYEWNPEPHLAELAYHFFEAAPGGDVEKASEYAERAGRRALTLVAYEEAARFFEQALQALELRQPVDAVARCELLLELGEAHSKAGASTEAKARFLAAADLARTTRLPEHFGRAALGYEGRFPWLRAGSDQRIVPLLLEALAGLRGQETVLSARLLARLAGALRDEPSLEPRSSFARQGAELARRLGDPDTLVFATLSLATATWGPDVEEFAALAREAGRLAAESGNPERELQTLWPQYIAWHALGDRARALAVATRYEALADELKQPAHQWYGNALRSHWALFQGRFEEAERLMEAALRLGERAQNWDAGVSYKLALFALRRHQGRLAEIEELLRQAGADYPGYRTFRALRPLVEVELGRPDDGRRSLGELAADEFAAFPRDSEWTFCLCVLAEVAARLGDGERANVLHDLLLPYTALNALAAGELAIGSVARYVGLLAQTLGRTHEAAEHFEAALEMNARMGARPWLAHTQAEYGRLLLEREEPRARELLAEALATYRELDMEAYAAALAS